MGVALCGYLVLLVESEVDLKDKLKNPKATMEAKGVKVNLAKTKVVWMGSRKDHMEIGKFPCAVCGRGVGSNSILCGRCNKWTHKRCSGIKGSLLKSQKFVCSRCKTGVKDQVLCTGLDIGNGGVLERVGSFCYLGDMLKEGLKEPLLQGLEWVGVS